MTTLHLQPLTAAAFAPFGDVIEVAGEADKIINQGMCGRHHDLAALDFGPGRAGISLFDAKARALPYTLDLMERHPLGSQAFIPLDNVPMIVTVAPDADGQPGTPQAFLSQPGQSINIHRNVWHGVLAPLGAAGRYVVVDHISDLPNLEEHWFEEGYTIQN
ncbi:ureidoglycolate lyase [Thalassovita mediterranea]|uniref:Ureidoglycolate hydrolase n=1 Tax=Thalassovita mediterranea TaxID=340021 RepID=A0A0P1H3E0_9RHOB|nr:ureidoglycolate lyase [Thalassovita mediterranea]CUH85029.1 Ureidoglycolate hydrolase [Thalassovita mediterranea]SIS35400.1 ureidoglycolate lyase [Thalassovita mediterranea]